MDLVCEERASDSPFIERVWRSQSEDAKTFTSIANANWGIVITKLEGNTTLTIRGPEIKASSAYCPPNGEWVGIQFKPGTLMPDFPAKQLMDRADVNLPEASSQSVWLKGAAWQLFDYENAESFVDKLVRNDLLIQDSAVDAVLQGETLDMSLRTVQRRFLKATGLTHNDIYQINRARYALLRLKQGASILDTVLDAGYSDQPHLTRSLKQFTAQTPAQVVSEANPEPVSFLFKTTPF